MSVGSDITKASGPGSDQRKVLIQRYLKDEVRSNRSSSSIASPGSNRLRNKTPNFEIREFSKGRRWSEAIAVGSLAFAEKVKSELGIKTMHREVGQAGGTYALRESSEAYGGEFAQEMKR